MCFSECDASTDSSWSGQRPLCTFPPQLVSHYSVPDNNETSTHLSYNCPQILCGVMVVQVIGLAAGEPDFDTPAPIVDTLHCF
jgi:hypothetical protein